MFQKNAGGAIPPYVMITSDDPDVIIIDEETRRIHTFLVCVRADTSDAGDSAEGKKCNCIDLKITNAKNNNLVSSGVISLRSRKQVHYPAISGNIYD